MDNEKTKDVDILQLFSEYLNLIHTNTNSIGKLDDKLTTHIEKVREVVKTNEKVANNVNELISHIGSLGDDMNANMNNRCNSCPLNYLDEVFVTKMKSNTDGIRQQVSEHFSKELFIDILNPLTIWAIRKYNIVIFFVTVISVVLYTTFQILSPWIYPATSKKINEVKRSYKSISEIKNTVDDIQNKINKLLKEK